MAENVFDRSVKTAKTAKVTKAKPKVKKVVSSRSASKPASKTIPGSRVAFARYVSKA